jgi:hypothetical protein
MDDVQKYMEGGDAQRGDRSPSSAPLTWLWFGFLCEHLGVPIGVSPNTHKDVFLACSRVRTSWLHSTANHSAEPSSDKPAAQRLSAVRRGSL